VKVVDKACAAAPLARANISIFERPDRLTRALLAARPFGPGMLGAVAASAARYPHAPAIISDGEEVSYRQLWRGSAALASHLAANGVSSESRVGLLCRNSVWFVHSLVAAAQLGADVVLLNTSFGPAQLQDTLATEGVNIILHDDEFAATVDGWEGLSVSQLRTIVSRTTGRSRVTPPVSQSRLVILTSGTTGRPRGAGRGSGAAAEGVAAVLGAVPFRLRDTFVIPAPFFHAWGLSSMLVALGLSGTVVTSAHFDPEEVLALTERHRADALIVVPTMLQRVCALPPDQLAQFETRSLRVIASSGSALPGPLATEVLNRFGPVLYNLYGSTEVATATIAGPRDLVLAPTTAGRPATGVRVSILGDDLSPREAGRTGRVFVGNAARFDGYTNGGGKETVGGLLATGDLGHFDSSGLLFIDGREDDMIVSGGENVYPVEVEALLNEHPDVYEAVVIGVPDDDFGQALKAFIVPAPGRSATPEALKAYVVKRLARYKVPRTFTFLDELPRTATGKVLKRELT
jgi:fatty-acyl-CoA synthase